MGRHVRSRWCKERERSRIPYVLYETEETQVCTLGFFILGVSFFVVVQTNNVYPDLLLARILFSIGGSASSTVQICDSAYGILRANGVVADGHSYPADNLHITSETNEHDWAR